MNDAALHALDVVVVAILKMHARNQQRAIGESAILAITPQLLVGEALQRLQKLRERQTRRR